MPPSTPLQQLDHWSKTQPGRVFLRQPRDRQLKDLTWGQTRDMVHRLAGSLRHLGLKRTDRVAVLSKNCAEWFIADLALQAGGFIGIPIYPTANNETIRYVLQHSEAKAIFVGKLDEPAEQRDAIDPELMRFDMSYPGLPTQVPWHQLLEMAGPLDDAGPEPDDVLSIIYTSGSTGAPKGAVVTYRAYSWASSTLTKHLGVGADDRLVSYLPLAHITERVYIEGAALYSGATVYFVESFDTFVEDTKAAQPTFFLSVPRLWTLFQKGILDKVGERRLQLLLALPLVGRLVAAKIRKELGLGAAKAVGCGSAPVAPALLHWYHRIGMGITEAWGMTENCAYATLGFPFRADKIGTVGRAGRDCEVRIGAENELLFKSPGLFREYHKDPVATAEAFTEDGFFRTGDEASIDTDGYVSITGRLHDNFKTAKGKFVAPVPIERELAQDNHIELACVMGSGLPYPVALVQLSAGAAQMPRETVRASLEQTAERIGIKVEKHARLGGILVVDDPWTVENEVLTPTLKIKRHVLERRFSQRVAQLKSNQVVWEAEL